MTWACGYRVVGSEPVGPGKTRATLAIPPFENRSMQPGLETIFANDMIRAFQDSNMVQVKPGEAKADYVLLGTIKKLEHSSTAYLDIDQSLIRRATISVEVKLQDSRTNKVIWKTCGDHQVGLCGQCLLRDRGGHPGSGDPAGVGALGATGKRKDRRTLLIM